MTYTAKSLGVEEYFNVDNGIDAGIYLTIETHENKDINFKFRILTTERYNPEKYWDVRNYLKDITDTLNEDANA